MILSDGDNIYYCHRDLTFWRGLAASVNISICRRALSCLFSFVDALMELKYSFCYDIPLYFKIHELIDFRNNTIIYACHKS